MLITASHSFRDLRRIFTFTPSLPSIPLGAGNGCCHEVSEHHGDRCGVRRRLMSLRQQPQLRPDDPP